MNELSGLKQDEQMGELLDLLENMQTEADQNHRIIQQKEAEIGQLQTQLQESLNLCEKLNRENKAENVQALKNDLIQTRELLQSEREDRKKADNMIKECRGRPRQAEKEKEYALTHQRNVEIPVEKPVLYEKCRICNRMAYQQAKEGYEYQRHRLEKKYQAKKTGFHVMIVVLWWYAIESTVFAAIRSEEMTSDFFIFIGTIWKVLCWFGKCILFIGQYVAQLGEKMPNGMAAVIVHWLLLIIVLVGLAGGTGVFLVTIGRKVIKMYQENCRDVVSIVVTATSMAIIVYLGDEIKSVIQCNLIVILLLVQAVYVGIRVHLNGCKRARGYY